MKKNNIRLLTEGGLMLALAIVLSHITIYQMPQGGSVSLGGLLPLMLFALRWGAGPGILLGAIYGIFDFLLKPYFFSVPQVLLDYILAYASIGLSGLAANKYDRNKSLIPVLFFSFLGAVCRYLSAVASGVIFFSQYAPEGVGAIYHSITYNALYLLPDAGIALFLLSMVFKPLMERVPINR